MAEIEFTAYDELLNWTGDVVMLDSYAFGEIIELKTLEDGRLSATALIAAIEREELAQAPKAGYDYQKHNKVRRKR